MFKSYIYKIAFRYFFSSSEVFIPKGSNSYSSWLDLFNWIPLFFCFCGFQSYLKTENFDAS